MLPHDHSVWVLLFEQIPTALRWVLITLTGGIFWLIQKLYLNHKERVNRLEKLIVTQGAATNKKIDALMLHLLNAKK